MGKRFTAEERRAFLDAVSGVDEQLAAMKIAFAEPPFSTGLETMRRTVTQIAAATDLAAETAEHALTD